MRQFSLQSIDGYLHLVLPIGHFIWEHFLGQLHIHLESGAYQNCAVIFTTGGHTIDGAQLEAVITTLTTHHLKLHKIVCDNRSTAIVAATLGFSVEQTSTFQAPNLSITQPLYLTKIIRSGVVLRHPGSVILRGDVHGGGEIIADGDILVWGKLKGKAHSTNPQATITALVLAPTQLKIGTTLSRVEGNSESIPELAYLEDGEICIVPALTSSHPGGINRQI